MSTDSYWADDRRFATPEAAEAARREQQEAQAAVEAARAARAAAHEEALRQAFMRTPTATEADWLRERDTVLAKDREQAALRREDAGRKSQAALYRVF